LGLGLNLILGGVAVFGLSCLNKGWEEERLSGGAVAIARASTVSWCGGSVLDDEVVDEPIANTPDKVTVAQQYELTVAQQLVTFYLTSFATT